MYTLGTSHAGACNPPVDAVFNEVIKMMLEGICEGRDGEVGVIMCFWFRNGVVVVVEFLW